MYIQLTPDEAIKLLEFKLTDEADDKSLKTQFKKMTLKYHPDRNHAPGATEKFIKIKEAYDVLQQVLKTRNQPKTAQVFSPGQQFGTDVSATGDYFTWTINFG